MCLSETWFTDNPATCTTKLLPKYDVIFSRATRRASKGRARGGLLIAYHGDRYISQCLFTSEDCIFVKFNYGNYKFILGLVYASPSSDFKDFLEILNDQINIISLKFPDLPIFIGGDFNSRVGHLNQFSDELILNNEMFSAERYSMDSKCDSKGIKLVTNMENNGYILINGRTVSDTPANYTFVNKIGKSLIDFFFVKCYWH